MIKLPLEADFRYHPQFISWEEADQYYQHILVDHEIDTHRLKLETSFSDFGKLMFIDEFIYNENRLPQQFYGKSFVWTDTMKELKRRVEELVGTTFNVCVCIYYPDGSSGVAFHFDPPAFGDTSIIPSLSLGEERLFLLRKKGEVQTYDIILEQGSLLIMGDKCQDLYEHCLPTDPIYKNGRINLTFRKYGFH